MSVRQSTTVDLSLSPRARFFVQTFSFLVGLLSCGVLIGWLYGIEWLKCIVPGLTPMSPTTAVCFLLLAAAIWIEHHSQSIHARRRIAGSMLASIVVLI